MRAWLRLPQRGLHSEAPLALPLDQPPPFLRLDEMG
jgi:hypothetical protein